MKTILTVGVYDILHVGHINLFKRARELGDRLVVAVQDGDVVKKYKPQANLVNNTEERVFMVQSIRYVDEVVVYRDVYDIVTEVAFDVFVTGPDQNHQGFIKAKQWCEAHGKEVVVLPRTEGISSSMLRSVLGN